MSSTIGQVDQTHRAYIDATDRVAAFAKLYIRDLDLDDAPHVTLGLMREALDARKVAYDAWIAALREAGL